MAPETAIQWGLAAAQAALKVLDVIEDDELKREAARHTREMLSDEKLLLRIEAQQALDKRRHEG